MISNYFIVLLIYNNVHFTVMSFYCKVSVKLENLFLRSYTKNNFSFLNKLRNFTSTCTVLQIRKGKRDDLGIIFHITTLKRML